ncbi:MAG: hypothetical protein INR73_06210 [Williamsia sp.]|nr:hypothetical protein [Williamsia sp.]
MTYSNSYSNIKSIYDSYKALSQKWLPEPAYTKMVSQEEQNREIQLLAETLHYDRFFFVINLHDCKIEHVHGVERWLGYPDKDFTLLKFLQIIHPSHLGAHHLTATQLITGLMRGDWKVEFMKQRYITNIALQHSKGHYILFKRLASVFQYNDKHQLLEYVNEFTWMGEYNEESYKIAATDAQGTKLSWLDDVLQRTRQAFQDGKFLSFQELRILRKYAYAPDISVADIAQSFKVMESTVVTHKRRILLKAEEIFHIRFENIRQLARFLREQGLV